MPSEHLTFPGHDGSQLAARLDLPDGPVLATALFAHCFTCSKDILPARRIASRLNGAGLAVLRFDFTGLGHSQGEFENTTFTSNVDDLVAAANHLAQRGLPPSLLIGHSLGGAAVLKARARIESTRAVATIAAPYAPEHVTQNFVEHLEQIAKDGVAEVQLGGRPFRIGKAFLEDIEAANLYPAIHNLRAALLIMHSPRDQIVSIDNAQAIFMAARHPKSFVTLDDADHLLTRPDDAEYAAGVIAAWASRYLELAPPPTTEDAPEGVVRVREADPDGFLQDIHAGRHHLYADEPVAFGGTDRGLSPYGLVSAGLGACTSMTIRMYARRKQWPLESVRVDVTHAKVHAQDSEAAGTAPSGGKIDQFNRDIHLEGPLDETQRARLLEIADRCPVHRTLTHGSRVVSRLV